MDSYLDQTPAKIVMIVGIFQVLIIEFLSVMSDYTLGFYIGAFLLGLVFLSSWLVHVIDELRHTIKGQSENIYSVLSEIERNLRKED